MSIALGKCTCGEKVIGYDGLRAFTQFVRCPRCKLMDETWPRMVAMLRLVRDDFSEACWPDGLDDLLTTLRERQAAL